MGALELRPYQQQAREAIHAQWDEGRQRTLLVLPTGTGKTIVFAAITEDQVRSGSRVNLRSGNGMLLGIRHGSPHHDLCCGEPPRALGWVHSALL